MSNVTDKEFYIANQGFLKSIPDAADALLASRSSELVVARLIDGDFVITEGELTASSYGTDRASEGGLVEVDFDHELRAIEYNANKIMLADHMSALLVGHMLQYVQKPPSPSNGFRTQPTTEEINLVTPKQVVYTSLRCDDESELAIDKIGLTGSRTYTSAEQYIFTHSDGTITTRITTVSANGRVLNAGVEKYPKGDIVSYLCHTHFPGLEHLTGVVFGGVYDTDEELDGLLAELRKGYIEGPLGSEYNLTDILAILRKHGKSAKRKRELCQKLGATTPDLNALRNLHDVLTLAA